jgi:Cu(I)/Ag(I) efflux system membrane fusion protein
VDVGLNSNGQTEIRKGLEAGQKVVVSGQFLVDSEANLKASTTRMADMSPFDAGAAAGATHRGEGKVESISKREITIAHGPMPTMPSPSMTMAFKLPRSGLPSGIAVGDEVEFELRLTNDGTYQVISIAKARATMKGAAGSPPAGTLPEMKR